MKSITKKNILQKIITLVLLILLIMNFITPTYSNASAADVGGVLLSPIIDFICSIGDVVINLLQRCMMGEWGNSNPNFSLNMFLQDTSTYFSDGYEEPEGEAYETINPENEFTKGWLWNSGEYYIPVATYSPEQIFTGNVAGLDINFINPNKYTKDDGSEVDSSAKILQPTIAKWYVALRNLAIVGLLSVLVYVAIRIIISSTASDKAKYKQMFMDWVIALCLLFFMHYIMSFVVTMTEAICDAISGDGTSTYIIQDETAQKKFATNFLGAARYKTQYKDIGLKLTYLIFYVALIIYTVVFTCFYLKRLLMMAFLTIMAPLVALTYPIDKMSDGKAQAFNTWLKEYIFNALIQPFHLIIYTVLVGSAMDLAETRTNIIYIIVALGFILPAEKILRKFFGFENAGAGTLGALSGFAAASMASKALSGKGGKTSGTSGAKSAPEGEKPPRFEKKPNLKGIEPDEDSNDTPQIRENNNQEQEDTDEVSNRYNQEGFSQNVDGEYYNPYTDEYDSNYDPHNDNSYNNRNLQEQEQGDIGEYENQGNPNTDSEDKNNRLTPKQQLQNLARYHNITPSGIAKGAGRRAIKGVKAVGKFGTRTAFKAAAGAIPAAIAVASGGGVTGAMTAFAAGSAIGGRAADRVIGAASNAPAAVRRNIDIARGNTHLQDKASMKQFKTDKNNVQYVKDMLTQQSGGIVPTADQVKEKMESFNPYLENGITNVKDILKAQKAEQYIKPEKAARIAAIGKNLGITADILNDDKKAKAQEMNLIQSLINDGKTQAEARKSAEYAMNIWKVQNGVANNLSKTAAKENKNKTTGKNK